MEVSDVMANKFPHSFFNLFSSFIVSFVYSILSYGLIMREMGAGGKKKILR